MLPRCFVACAGNELSLVRAWVAQLVERVLGKDEVTGSIPVPGSSSCEGKLHCNREGPSGGNSTVESHSSKVMVAGSNPVPRSNVFEVGESQKI